MHTPHESLGLEQDPRYVANVTGREGLESGIEVSVNPTTGEPIAGVRLDTAETYERTIVEAQDSFKMWRSVPAPVRGEVVRRIGEEMRRLREPLGELESIEVGKIRAEGIGEVQETIDIADYAVGLSRMIGGRTIPSERPAHRMMEQWLPLGLVGVVTAFNFPNAVWGWNAMLAAVCGDVTIWKPSLLAPLTAMATNAIADRVATEMGYPGVFRLVIGTDDEIGELLIADRRVPLISATGSCGMGRHVGQVVAGRLGRCLLELGGNNAVIVDKDADLDLATKSTVFGSVGTAGQRCTSTRRLYVHRSIADELVGRMARAYETITIGDPLAEGTLVGPVIGQRTVDAFRSAIAKAREQGGEVVVGGEIAEPEGLDGWFVQPTIIRAPASNELPISKEETFAPILYVFTYDTIDEAIEMQNSVDQGLSSAIFTESIRTCERFLNPDGSGSDCGLAYVNLGTSGAEIGGAFGGEKDTGGGREAGSDSWKAYMRRQSCTINFGGELRLAQGIRFE
ncbi:MAG TPA: aldehyde dehydrogenase family protein [Phycisphaerales bacterium]|nr:aldehyde dehydrogenase family protein [Phycisphaerales bacterium]